MEFSTELASLLDAIPMPAGVVDGAGNLCAANAGWAQANTPLAAMQPKPGPGYVARLQRAEVDGAATLASTIQATLGDRMAASALRGGGLTACVELSSTVPEIAGSAWVTRVAPAGANIVLVTHEDVSKRQRVQADLRKSRARLRTILTGAPLALFAVDTEGRFSLVEGMAAGAAGLITPEVVGRRVDDEYRHIPDLVATVQAALDGATAVTTVEVGALAFEVHCSPDISSAGQQRGAVGIATDVSERVRAQRLKDDFVSVVNHELRTPLTSIHGALSLLENNVAGDLPPDAIELTKIARTSVDRLIRMITDLLDLDRLDSGRFELSCAIVDLAEIVGEAVRELAALATDADVKVNVRAPAGAMVDADKDRVHQVVTNLLSNAIKFSPAAADVDIEVRVTDAYVRVSVTDRGPGIMPEDRSKLFRKFSQLAAPGDANRRGSGLGLVISKSIVEAHGGRISLRSEVGAGSTFFFELPSARLGGRTQPLGTPAKASAAHRAPRGHSEVAVSGAGPMGVAEQRDGLLTMLGEGLPPAEALRNAHGTVQVLLAQLGLPAESEADRLLTALRRAIEAEMDVVAQGGQPSLTDLRVMAKYAHAVVRRHAEDDG